MDTLEPLDAMRPPNRIGIAQSRFSTGRLRCLHRAQAPEASVAEDKREVAALAGVPNDRPYRLRSVIGQLYHRHCRHR